MVFTDGLMCHQHVYHRKADDMSGMGSFTVTDYKGLGNILNKGLWEQLEERMRQRMYI